MMLPVEIRAEILNLLKAGPRSRRYIEATLCHAAGDGELSIPPSSVSSALDRMVNDGGLYHKTLLSRDGSDGKHTAIYSLHRPLTAEQIAQWEADYRWRDRVLDSQALCDAGQNYVFGLFSRSKRFKMPDKALLGNFPVPRLNGRPRPADLILDIRDSTPVTRTLVVEVKNQFETWIPSKGDILQLLENAVWKPATPILVVAHLVPEAAALYRRLGIEVLHLRRQLVPGFIGSDKTRINVKRELAELQRKHIVGPERIEFVSGTGRFYQDGLSPEAQRDLAIVKDPTWIHRCDVAWDENFGHIEEVLRAGENLPGIRARIERAYDEQAAYVSSEPLPDWY